MFGAAVAMARLLRLDEQRMAWALGLAASQPVGLKVQFGSDTKSFHPGRAAQNGMVSALLAQQGFTASEVAIEGFDGWGQALSTRHDWSQVTDGLGQHYELVLNTCKPFACGIVSHPAIDAAIQLRNANGLQPDAIQASRDRPMTDAQLEGKFAGLAEEILPGDQTRRLMDLCWKAWDLGDTGGHRPGRPPRHKVGGRDSRAKIGETNRKSRSGQGRPATMATPPRG